MKIRLFAYKRNNLVFQSLISHKDVHPLVIAGAYEIRIRILSFKDAFRLIQTHAESEQLKEPTFTTDDEVETFFISLSDVTGVIFAAELIAFHQIISVQRISHCDVGASVS